MDYWNINNMYLYVVLFTGIWKLYSIFKNKNTVEWKYWKILNIKDGGG